LARRRVKLAITVARLAEDAFRENLARHHQEDRRRRSLDHAGDHRGSKSARRIGEALKGRV